MFFVSLIYGQQVVGDKWRVTKQIGGVKEQANIQLATSTWFRKKGDHQLQKNEDKNEDKGVVDCSGKTSKWIIPLLSK
jgi:hypothetical protein